MTNIFQFIFASSKETTTMGRLPEGTLCMDPSGE